MSLNKYVSFTIITICSECEIQCLLQAVELD